MGTPTSARGPSLDEIGQSFERQLMLTNREKVGVVIVASVIFDHFVGFIYGLVAKVITLHDVNRDASIKNFSNQRRVVDMELWAYRHSLVLLAEVLDDGSPHTLPLKFGTFWVELHGVPGFCMIVAIVKSIGAKLGDVKCVYNHDGDDCVGRFIRIRVQFDVELPLIRRIPITFSKVGERVVDFKYEYLSEYCFACGSICHSTQVYVKTHEGMGVLIRYLCISLQIFLVNELGLRSNIPPFLNLHCGNRRNHMLGSIGNLMARVRLHIHGVWQIGDPGPVDTAVFPTLPSLMSMAMKEQSASQVKAVNHRHP
ncbi:unnamed protein product [Prunus armeniaca]|uniref:Zinc knuckle CX2CX4HX4C domain-containing protein n=1 Tax=Prunus armeniaca TaxID=36596 RepID=A0A6J5UT23_PRUAR|nr:unnamed protein product [Prunus armeniaca]